VFYTRGSEEEAEGSPRKLCAFAVGPLKERHRDEEGKQLRFTGRNEVLDRGEHNCIDTKVVGEHSTKGTYNGPCRKTVGRGTHDV